MSDRKQGIRNEKRKLLANYLNGMGIAVMAIGGIAPLVSYLSGNFATSPFVLLAIALACLALSITLHLIASRQLEELE